MYLFTKMRKIDSEKIIAEIKLLVQQANYYLPEDVHYTLREAYRKEVSVLGKIFLEQILENAEIAAAEKIPLCQDTGLPNFFVELGNEIILDCNIIDAINKGVEQGYKEAYFRKSVVQNPLNRKQVGYIPAMVYIEPVLGNRIKISVLIKGGGSENMSRIRFFPPTTSLEEIKEFVIGTVKSTAAYACPPVVVGVGIGGDFSSVGLLAKKALLREIGSANPELTYAELEQELLRAINNLGIGPQGVGGKITALSVHIEYTPCHITTIPVGINLQCHSYRKRTVII